jgi:hypothetical protein
VLYGSGKSDDPIMNKNEDLGTLSGQGTHFGHNRSAGKEDPSTSGGTGPTTTGNAAPHLLGSQQLHHDDGESTASIKSGVAGYPQGSPGLTGTSGMQGELTSYRDEKINPSSTTGTHPSDSAYQTGTVDQRDSRGIGDSTGVGAGGLSAGERPSEQERQEGIAHIGETIKDRSYPVGGSRRDETPLTENTDPKVQAEPQSEVFQQHRDDDLTGGAKPQSEDHHYGRDAGLAGGAGAVGLGTYEASRDKSSNNPMSSSRPAGDDGIGSDSRGQGYGAQESTQPSTSTGTKRYQNPYQTSHIDPRVDKNPTSRMPGAFEQDRPIESTQKDHHYDRDAGLVGAGAGAYEADKHHQKSGNEQPWVTSGTTTSTTGPTSSYNQPSDTGASAGYIPGTDARVQDPSSTGNAPGGTTTDLLQGTHGHEHHYGRDAGAAAGLGAGGVGAYGLSKHEDKPLPDTPQSTEQRGTTTSTQPTEDPNLRKDTDHHYGRGAGIAAAGVGAGAYGAHEYSQHRDAEAEKERMKDEEARRKQMEKEREAHEKSMAKDRKEQEKEMEKQQKAQEKAIAKEEKAHEKAVAKEEKKQEKEEAAIIAAQEKEHRKQQERYEKEQGTTDGVLAGKESERDLEREESKEKKGGLLGFLHRKRDPESKELEKEEEDSSHKTEAALGAAGAVGAGSAAYEYERHHRPAEEPYDQSTGTTGKGSVEDRVREKMTTDPSHRSAGTTTGTTAGTMAGTTAGTTTDPYSGTGTTADPSRRGLDTTSTDPSQPGGFSNEGVTGSGNVPSSTQRQYDQHGSHRGVEAAAGLGAVGAIGAGAYEAEKHHERKDGYDQTDTTRGTEGTTTSTGHHHGTAGTIGTEGNDPSGYVRGNDGVLRMKPDDSHHGVETAAGLGAVGAGAGAYEANKHYQKRDGYDQTGARTTLGAGDVSDQGQSDQPTSHRGAETVAGVGAVGLGAGAYEADKHRHQDPYTQSGTTQGRDRTLVQDEPQSQHESHRGAETAAGLGAGGAGTYAAGKHHHDASYDRSGSPGGTEFGSRQEYDNAQQDSHHGAKNAAGAGALGASVAGYEAEKHHHDKNDNNQYAKSGRNVLHKDPPQGYQDSRRGDNTAAGVGTVGAGIAGYQADKHLDRGTDRPSTYNTERDTDDSCHRGAETSAGLGAVGAGAYGADKLHKRREAEREPTTTATGNSHPGQ